MTGRAVEPLRPDQARRVATMRTAGVADADIAVLLGVDPGALAGPRRPPWPPPLTGTDEYAEVTVRNDDATNATHTTTVRARRVALWGRPVLINDVGDVHNQCCLRFVPVVELASPRNAHIEGLRGNRRRSGVPTPWAPEE